MIHPVLAMAIALGMLVGLMLVLRFYQTRFKPHPEVPRKLLHVGMGLSTIPFPWLFDRAWPVLVLSGIGVVILALTRTLPALKNSLGTVVGGVRRFSVGDLCFPVSVAILFLLHDHRPLLFIIPMLVLSLADAVAALIGIVYGRLHYEASGGDKTAEGSIAFFTVAFLSVHVPLLLFTDTGRAETLLIALMLGLVVMLMEAISWRGLDNLFIPLGAFLLLSRYLPLSVHELLIRLGVTVGLVLFVFFFRKRSTLTPAGLLGAALFGYAAFALGGVLWLTPPLILFLAHALLWPRSEQNVDRHSVHVVVATAGPGLIYLTLYAMYGDSRMLLAYATLFAAHLAIIGASWIPLKAPPLSRGFRLAACVAGGELFTLVLVGLALLLRHGHYDLQAIEALASRPQVFLAINAATVAPATVAFALLYPRACNKSSVFSGNVHYLGGLAALAASGATCLATRL